MLPARLRLSTERGVEAPLEEAEYDDDDVEDLSNLLKRSLCAPELETRRTTGLRPGVVVRSGIVSWQRRRAPRSSEGSIDRRIGSAESQTRTESKSAPPNSPGRLRLRPLFVSLLPLSTPLYLAACPPLPPPPPPFLPIPSHPHTFFRLCSHVDCGRGAQSAPGHPGSRAGE